MMKKTIIAALLCLVSTTVTLAQGKQLVILHTNDTHSTVYPLNPTLGDTLVAGRGGYLRRMKMIEEERAKAPKLLLIDSGDFSQGSPYYNLYQGEVEVKLMNMMKYDAATIGNHEFDFGLENMAKLFKMAEFPILCANYDFTGTVVEGLVQPYTIIKRDGVKIGLFGICPPLKGLVFDHNCEGVKYLDPATEAQRWTDYLRNVKKCDLVICISHLGWEMGKKVDDDDNRVIAKTRGIDLVLGGHSHTYFPSLKYITDLDGKQVPVDQNGKHAVYVGKVILNLDKK